MKPLSYWVANPEVREYAIPLVETNIPRRAVVLAIIEKFGTEVAPKCDEQITKLRMQVAKGRWGETRGEKISPKGRNDSGGNRNDTIDPRNHMAMALSAAVCGREETLEKISPKGRNDKVVSRNDMPVTPTATKFKRYGDKTFWDYHPSIMRFAAKLIEDEDVNIQDTIEKRFGKKFRPEPQQLKMLREGLETGRFTVTAPAPKTLSEATRRLFSNEQATECLIPGIRIWTRIHCLKRQLNFRLGRHEMSWNNGSVSRQSKRVLIPELAICAKCVNWIPLSDLRILRRKIRKGFTVEVAHDEPEIYG